MLKIHVLNVGHGDSIVLEFVPPDGSDADFAVVDCNGVGEANSALKLLQRKGANALRFVALTHPHADHYNGLGEICDAYRGRIDAFLSFPLDRNQGRLDKLIERYAQDGKLTSAAESAKAVEFLKYIFAAHANQSVWEAPTVSNRPAIHGVAGFPGVTFELLLPGSNAHQVLDHLVKGKIPSQSADVNDLSLVLRLTYAGREIVLGADATVVTWGSQSLKWDRQEVKLKTTVAKLPHHGSEKDCANQVLDVLFSNGGQSEQFAIISASGASHHPNAGVLRELAARGIKPYCTNLAEYCGGTVRETIAELNPGTSPELLRNLQMLLSGPTKPRPCQGDITIIVQPDGAVQIDREFQAPCVFRGDWEKIFPATYGNGNVH